MDEVPYVRLNQKQTHTTQHAKVNMLILLDCGKRVTFIYLTTLVRMVVLVGHFCCTDFCRQP